MIKRYATSVAEMESEEDEKPEEFHMERDLLEENYNFSQGDAANAGEDDNLTSQNYYISPLTEIQEVEFTNEEYIQDVTIDGLKIERSDNNFKYEFVLADHASFFAPELDDCFDISRPEKINNLLSQEERERRGLGELCCIALRKQTLAVSLSQPCVLLYLNLQAVDTTPEKIVSIPSEHGYVSCMDLYQDAQILCCGTSKGVIIFIDVTRGTIIQHFSNIHKAQLLAIRMIHRIKDDILVTLSCDQDGVGQLLNLEKGFFSYEVVPQPLTKQTKYPCNTVQVLHPDIMERFYAGISESKAVKRIVAVMNAQKLWILCVRITTLVPPEMVILFEFERATPIIRSEIFNTCCSFGEGFLKLQKSQKELTNNLTLMCCWGTKLFHVDFFDVLNFQDFNFHSNDPTPICQNSFRVSQFIDFRSRILGCNFLEPSLCTVVTKDRGIFLVNTINLLNFHTERTSHHIRALNFKECEHISYKGNICKVSGHHYLSGRQKMLTALSRLIPNARRIQKLANDDDGKIINYVQSFSSCMNDDCQSLAILHNNSVSIAKIAGWEKSINSFYLYGEWVVGMHYVVSIYLGTNRLVTRFLKKSLQERKELIKDKLIDISTKYFRMVMDCIKDSKAQLDEAQRSFSHSNDMERTFSLEVSMHIDEHQQYVLSQIHSYKTLYSILIEFLLLTDSNDMLFNQFMPQTEAILQDGNTFFLQCLEPFYQQKKVNYIPEDVLIYIVNYYKRRHNIDLLQKYNHFNINRLVFSLDHKIVESAHLIQVCLRVGLLKCMAIICERGDPEEFLTPIIKIWCYILVYIEKAEYEQAQYFLLRALTYIKMALQRKNITGEPMQTDKYDEVVKQISLWVFTEDNLEKLLLLEPAPSFEILYLFLQPEVGAILNKVNLFSGDQYIVKYHQQFNQQGDWIEKSERATNKGRVMVFIQSIVERIVQDQSKLTRTYRQSVSSSSEALESNGRNRLMSIEEKDVQLHFVMFQIRVFMSHNVLISNARIICNLGFIFKNLRALDQLYLQELVGHLSFQQKQEIKKWPNQREAVSFLKSEFLVQVLRMVWDNIQIDKDLQDFKELSYLADLTTLSTTCVFLAQVKQEYKRAFDFYILSKNQLVKSKIFGWLWTIMERLEISRVKRDSDYFDLLKNFLLQKLTDLIKINSEKTRDIVARFHSNAESQVIHKLEVYPELQLEYVENVLKKEREAGHKVGKEMLMLNAALLCQLHPERLLPELKQYEYPLDDILPLCRQFKIDKATAYVLERLGSISEAVSIHVTMLREVAKSLAKDLQFENDIQSKVGAGKQKTLLSTLFNQNRMINSMSGGFNSSKKESKRVFRESVSSVIRVCELNNDQKDEIWYVLLDNIIDIRDNVFKKNDALRSMQKLCTKQICHIIATVAKNSNLEILLERLQTRYTNLDMGQLKLTFQEIISNYVYVENVLSNSHGLIKADLVMKIESLLNIYQKGVISKGLCGQCRIDVSQEGEYASEVDGVVVFRCGHAFHRGCVVEQQSIFLCQMCCRKDEAYAYNLLFINSKISLDKLTENLKKRNQYQINQDDLQDQEDQEIKLQDMLNNENFTFKQVVSKDAEGKRKRRTNKMRYFDRKRTDNIILVDSQSADQVKALRKK